MTALPEGTFLHNRYTVTAVLGIGGFGITYAGRDETLGRRVAVKELFLNGGSRAGTMVQNPPGYSTERWTKSITSFLHEARTLASIEDPSVVGVYDYFDENNSAYMVMKFIEGATLDKYIYARGGRLSEREAVNFTHQIGRALQLLHAANILHRDVKPSNVIVTPERKAVLIDFGSAREFAADRTVQQTAIATIGFAPPEQYHAFGRKGAFTDVYALAATCYYMLSGEPPGSEISPYAASTPLMPALMHALAFSPSDRTPNVPAFLAELDDPRLVPPDYATMLGEQPTAAFGAAALTGLPTAAEEIATRPDSRQREEATASLSAFMRTQASVPNSGMAMPPYIQPAPAPPLPVPAVQPARNMVLPTAIGLAVTALVAVLAFILFSGNGGNKGQVATLTTPTIAPASPATLVAVVISDTATPRLSDTPIPTATNIPPTDTAIPATALPATDIPVPPTATAMPPPPPSDTPVPPPPQVIPTNTPKSPPPPPSTSTPRPPKPPTSTPKPPPPAPPTSTPRPPKPPTNTPVPPPPQQTELGELNIAAYCKRVNTNSKPHYVGGLWACYSFDLATTTAANPTSACAQQHPGTQPAWGSVSNGDSWYCAKDGQRVGNLDMDAYCGQQHAFARAEYDTDPDQGIDPLTRWTCVIPGKINGDIDVAAASDGCTQQYGVPAVARPSGDKWLCRKQLFLVRDSTFYILHSSWGRTMQLRCTNCGSPLAPNDTFCGECGAPVIRTAQIPPSGTVNSQIVYPPPFPPPAPAPVRKRGGNTAAIVGIIVAILAVSGVGGWLLLGNKGNSTITTPTPIAQASPTANVVALSSPTAAPAQASPTKAAPGKPFIRGNIRKLTNNTDTSVGIYNVSWSFSGKNLAYSLSGDKGQHIFTIPLSGGQPQQLTFGDTVQDYKPVWFGDKSLAFTRKLNNESRFYYTGIGGDITPTLLISGTAYSQFQLVDSNSTGLFTGREVSSSSSDLNLYNFRFSASEPAAHITKDLGNLKSDWVGVASSSSDRHVVLSRTANKKQTDLFVRDTDNGDELQVTNTPEEDWQPSWRVGSRLIAYNVTDVDNSQATPTFGATHIYVMALAEDGSPATPIRLIGDDQGNFDGYPAWSSADNLIAFVSNRDGADNVYVMEYTTSTDSGPYMGVLTTMLSPQMVEESNLSVSSGAIVREVASGSPADLAGIEAQDIITSIAGESIDDLHPIPTLLAHHNIGDTIELKVQRKGNSLTLSVQTGQHPANARPDR